MFPRFCPSTISPLQNIVRDVVWNDYLGINPATIAWNQLGGVNLKATFRFEQSFLYVYSSPALFFSTQVLGPVWHLPSKSKEGPWHFDQVQSASSHVTTAPGNRRSHSVSALWRPTNCLFPSPWRNGVAMRLVIHSDTRYPHCLWGFDGQKPGKKTVHIRNIYICSYDPSSTDRLDWFVSTSCYVVFQDLENDIAII